MLIIIDETQRLYPNDGSNSFPISWASDFWTDLKDFQSRQSAKTTKVRLLFLVTYPVRWLPTVSTELIDDGGLARLFAFQLDADKFPNYEGFPAHED